MLTPVRPSLINATNIASLLIFVVLSSCQLNTELQPDDYAFWSSANPDGSWTKVAEDAVRSTALPRTRPADVSDYCPQYSKMDAEGRVRFWVGLLSLMAEYESDFDPQTEFKETLRDSEKRRVVSRGLLQISIESANQERYSCAIRTDDELHDPGTNIRCGARILSNWVTRDGVIGPAGGESLGGARYWSVLRENRESSTQIGERMGGLEFCRG